MDVSADVAAIVAQAPEWNFAGDCALLDLMKRISQNLQERGERTNRSLAEFETSVRRVDIALDNATNSLRSLQFGQQFVEYRVEEVDDDDFVMPEEQNKKPDAPVKSSQEMASEFLQNNLQMFRKNFEPVTIEVPDSDDEDGAVNTTTIFRAKNPYDSIPLPYIIGSRQWEEHKYAGLYDSAENSENEEPEQFSSSSSDEMETAVQQTSPKRQQIEAQQSDSSSLASLPRELVNAAASNRASPATLPTAQPVTPATAAPRAKPRPIISSRRNAHESDLFAALRESPPSDEPPSSSSSPTSSTGFPHRNSVTTNLPRAEASLSSSSSSASKPIIPVRQMPPKLFDEPAATPNTTPLATPIQSESEAKTAADASQIKRKPVNLFNDDEFNSFMSEIVQKVQAKAESNSNSTETIGKAKESPKVSVSATPKPTKTVTNAPSAAQAIVSSPNKLNLFDESPPLSPQYTAKTKPAPATSASVKALPKSLFDDNLEDDVDDFLSSFTTKSKPRQQAVKTSLFDDDDDDLDIDDIFAKKTLPTQPSKVIGKPSLFDDEEDDYPNDIFGVSSKKTIPEKGKQQQTQVAPLETTAEPPSVPRKSIFDDLGDDDLFGTPKSNKNLIAQEQKQSEAKLRDLYIEVEPPEDTATVSKQLQPELDIFAAEHKEQESKREVIHTVNNKKTKPFTIPKNNLFSDDFSDDEPITTSAAKQAEQATGTIEIRKPMEASNNASFLEEIAGTEKILLNAQTQPTNKQDVKNAKNLEDLPITTVADSPIPRVENPSTQSVNESPNSTAEETSPSTPAEPSIVKDTKLTATEAAELLTSTAEETSTSSVVAESHASTEAAEAPIPKVRRPITLAVAESAASTAEELSTVAEPEKPTIEKPLTSTTQEAPIDEQQDPIISLVAEITNKKSGEDNETAHDPSDIEAAEQLMKNYNSIFSDEPPDDSEFFQSLGTSSLSSLSASKMFDNEPDFFEPTLPDIPKAAASLSATTVEQPNNEYGGIRLFSDVPPDDDDDDDEHEDATTVPATQRKTTRTESSTTRIHTIFYDDFSETARAGDTAQAVQQTAIFDEEPPTDVVDRSANTVVPDLPKPTSPVKKLQMPNININVKALLPGSGGLPKIARKQEQEQLPSATIKQTTKSSSGEADNILQCVSKTRVRGPAHRRPSTRRARKENYAKSLQEEQGDNTKEQEKEAATAGPIISEVPNKQNVTATQEPAALIVKPHSTINTASFLESDESDADDDDDALFNVSKKQRVVKPTSFISADLPPEDDFKPVARTVKLAPFFLDSDDDEDGIFSSPLPPVASNPMPAPTAITVDKNSIAASQTVPAPILVENSTEDVLKSKAIKTLTTFLDSDDEINSSPFGLAKSIATAEPIAVASSPVKQPSKDESKPIATFANTTKHFTSFLDNADDDDDEDALFMPAPKRKANTSTLATIVPASAVLPTKVETKSTATAAPVSLQQKESAQLEIQSKSRIKKTTLFDDSDDDDDLFGHAAAPVSSAATTAAKISKPTDAPRPTASAAPVKSALFDSDSEPDEPPKLLSSKVKMPAKPSKSLFSDDEDDDDLFGSAAGAVRKTKPIRTTPRNVVKSTPSKAATTPVPTQSSTSDNPLADLLGP